MTLTLSLWKTALTLGAAMGCTPGDSVMSKLKAIVEHDRVDVGPEDWPYYLWPEIAEVGDAYASCLVGALKRAVRELRDPTLGLQYPINEGTAMMTKGALGLATDQVDALDRLREWCGQGGFTVRLTTVRAESLIVLER